MTADEFLSQFDEIPDDQLHQLRRSVTLDAWPDAQEFYVDVVNDWFGHNARDFTKTQRLIQILREMVYTDGRSFEALMWIAEMDRDETVYYGRLGVSALAGIVCYLRVNAPVATIDVTLLRARLERLAERSWLAHNARACLAALE